MLIPWRVLSLVCSMVFFSLWFPRIEENPEEADFFFVPIYAACVMTKEKKQADESRFLATKAASKTPRW